MLQARDEEKLARQFGAWLVQLREERNLTLRAAAKLIGIDHTRLISLEQGIERTTGRPTLPSAELAVRIALAYRYPKEKLLAEAGYIPWLLDKAQTERLLDLAHRQINGEPDPQR